MIVCSFYWQWVLTFCFGFFVQVGCLVAVFVAPKTDYGFVSGQEELGDRPIPLYYLKPMLSCGPLDDKLCQSRLLTLVFGIANTWTAMKFIYTLMVVMAILYVGLFSRFYYKVYIGNRKKIEEIKENLATKNIKIKLFSTQIMVLRAMDEALFFNLSFHILGLYMGRQEIYDILKSFSLLVAGDYLLILRDFNSWAIRSQKEKGNEKLETTRKISNEMVGYAGYIFYINVVTQSLFGVANLGMTSTLPPSLLAYASLQFTFMVLLKVSNYVFHRVDSLSVHQYNLFYGWVAPIMKATLLSMFIWNNSEYYAENVLIFV